MPSWSVVHNCGIGILSVRQQKGPQHPRNGLAYLSFLRIMSLSASPVHRFISVLLAGNGTCTNKGAGKGHRGTVPRLIVQDATSPWRSAPILRASVRRRRISSGCLW
jgi:hypothetical protein